MAVPKIKIIKKATKGTNEALNFCEKYPKITNQQNKRPKIAQLYKNDAKINNKEASKISFFEGILSRKKEIFKIPVKINIKDKKKSNSTYILGKKDIKMEEKSNKYRVFSAKLFFSAIFTIT